MLSAAERETPSLLRAAVNLRDLEVTAMSALESESVYHEICQNIRETDSVSFKLLNLVPLGSTLGGALLAVLQKNSLLQSTAHSGANAAIVLLSLAGATIVFGLHKWELRNIQKCKWLIDRAAALEPQGSTQYKGWNEQITTWGKTRAESLIYTASMLVWLIPIVMLLIGCCVRPSH
jgi:hypothetical protein